MFSGENPLRFLVVTTFASWSLGAQNQGFDMAIGADFGPHHQFGDFNLAHPVDPAQQPEGASAALPFPTIKA
jgi:hypothetical protein